MIKGLIKTIACLCCGILCGLVAKACFVISNPTIYKGLSLAGFLDVWVNGLTMDLSVSAYMTVIPGLLFCAALSFGSKGIIDRILKYYFGIVSILTAGVVLLDSILYGYWGFKLDATPFFYFTSSPKAAIASAEAWMIPAGLAAWALLSSLFWFVYIYFTLNITGEIQKIQGKSKRLLQSAGMLLAVGTLIIPIRGGVTVSTMNLSRAYFSSQQRLNHAAVNPVFSLLYSLSHQADFRSQFRFMPDSEAEVLFDRFKEMPCDSVAPLLKSRSSKPDIYLLIMESFSNWLFPSTGGGPVALALDSIAGEGLLFTNFYANGFRTDRGLVSILSGYPSPPTVSVMKYVEKTQGIPSWPKTLRDEAGYATEYYYGGDAGFTNMKAYLLNCGFDKIISDKDFPLSERLSKWGAHDGPLFNKVAGILSAYDPQHPVLRVIQTSSSHEPFEVPYEGEGHFKDKRAKAFAYADSCAASFIKTLRKREDWDNALVIVTADHYGAYPDLKDPFDMQRIPLIMTGGALERKGIDRTTGSQSDLAATITGALGLTEGGFKFSRNLLNTCTRHFAFVTRPGFMGWAEDGNLTGYNLDAGNPLEFNNGHLEESKAMLQTLYNDLSER